VPRIGATSDDVPRRPVVNVEQQSARIVESESAPAPAVVSDGGGLGPTKGPGSAAHRATRWEEYQARGGSWSRERWENVYEQNLGRANRANQAADTYHKSLGWGRREVTVDVEGVSRRLDIADEATFRGREIKTGYQSATQENLWEIQRDQILREKGWDIQWRLAGPASRQLREALGKAQLPFTGGTR
jgi:hypothetical protein